MVGHWEGREKKQGLSEAHASKARSGQRKVRKEGNWQIGLGGRGDGSGAGSSAQKKLKSSHRDDTGQEYKGSSYRD